jgi:hypothetical protein
MKRIMVAAALIALVFSLPRKSFAGTLGPDIISLFPNDTGELAYTDLKQARQFPWFPQLKEQMLPAKFREFEQFLAAAGVDPNTQVTDLAWGLVPNKPAANASAGAVPTSEQIVGIALGQFNPSSAEAYFTSKKLPIVKVRTFSLFAFGGGSGPNDLFFFFLDASTAARAGEPGERQRDGLGSAEPRLHPPGDATAGPGGLAIPRRCPTRRQTQGHDDHDQGRQRGGRPV